MTGLEAGKMGPFLYDYGGIQRTVLFVRVA